MAPSTLSSWAKIVTVCAALLVSSEARVQRRGNGPLSPSQVLQAYDAPLTDSATTTALPSPPDGTCLKAITLGRGTQNYTCAGSTASFTPVAVGAVATLFDAVPLLEYVPHREGLELLRILPRFLVSFPYQLLENSSLPVSGHHFFNSAGVPTFDLTTSGVGLLLGAKVGDIPAPKRASAGPDNVGNGAVDWLALTSKPGSSGLQEVYRVHTAGGKAPATCEGQPATIEFQYSAVYWFYG